ncbi:unnamed protein product [Paramecium pentaurelia]|uniref:Uncharacterized protein n=1 Tax=Paramecium pentaurelia TaxID=43138 RepID=A0A8S1YGJ5_9CILI|nr:unnamed protein product [Paramecium pentaurelia]
MTILQDPKLDKKQRLLCTQCMENFETDAKTIGLKKIIQIIEDIIEKNMSNLEDITQKTIQQLQICTKSIQELKEQFMKLFDSLINIAEDWTQNLLAFTQQSKQYSFYDELDNFIKNQNDFNDSDITLINNINRSWMTQLQKNLNQYIQDKDKVNFKEIKQIFTNISCSIQSQKSEIKLKLIDQSPRNPPRGARYPYPPLQRPMQRPPAIKLTEPIRIEKQQLSFLEEFMNYQTVQIRMEDFLKILNNDNVDIVKEKESTKKIVDMLINPSQFDIGDILNMFDDVNELQTYILMKVSN